MPETSKYPIGTLAEIEVRECIHPEHWYLTGAMWAYWDETDSEGWLTTDGLWWCDAAAFRRPMKLVPAA